MQRTLLSQPDQSALSQSHIFTPLHQRNETEPSKDLTRSKLSWSKGGSEKNRKSQEMLRRLLHFKDSHTIRLVEWNVYIFYGFFIFIFTPFAMELYIFFVWFASVTPFLFVFTTFTFTLCHNFFSLWSYTIWLQRYCLLHLLLFAPTPALLSSTLFYGVLHHFSGVLHFSIYAPTPVS